MILVANMSISSEVAKCWRGNMKNGFELTGNGSGLHRYMSWSQNSVALGPDGSGASSVSVELAASIWATIEGGLIGAARELARLNPVQMGQAG